MPEAIAARTYAPLLVQISHHTKGKRFRDLQQLVNPNYQSVKESIEDMRLVQIEKNKNK